MLPEVLLKKLPLKSRYLRNVRPSLHRFPMSGDLSNNSSGNTAGILQQRFNDAEGTRFRGFIRRRECKRAAGGIGSPVKCRWLCTYSAFL